MLMMMMTMTRTPDHVDDDDDDDYTIDHTALVSWWASSFLFISRDVLLDRIMHVMSAP